MNARRIGAGAALTACLLAGSAHASAAHAIQEDDARWDCAFDGDGLCGDDVMRCQTGAGAVLIDARTMNANGMREACTLDHRGLSAHAGGWHGIRDGLARMLRRMR